jgi:hypothetical protein
MGLSAQQIGVLKQIYRAKGDLLEAAMAERLISRGVDEETARSAARKCANKIWKNGMLSGAATTVVLGSLFTPVVGGIAGGSMAALAGWKTLLHSNACAPIRDDEVTSAAAIVARGDW